MPKLGKIVQEKIYNTGLKMDYPTFTTRKSIYCYQNEIQDIHIQYRRGAGSCLSEARIS